LREPEAQDSSDARPRSRRTLVALVAGLCAFGLGLGGALAVLARREAAPVPGAAPRARELAFDRAQAALLELRRLDPGAYPSANEALARLEREKTLQGYDDTAYLGQSAALEAELRTRAAAVERAQRLASQEEAARRAQPAADAGAHGVGEVATLYDVVALDLSTPRRLRLSTQRHNLALVGGQLKGKHKWKSEIPLPTTFKAAPPAFLVVISENPSTEVRSISALVAPTAVTVRDAVWARFIEFRPFESPRPDEPVPQAELENDLRGGRILPGIRMARENGAFVEVEGLGRERWVEFAPLTTELPHTWAAVARCDGTLKPLTRVPVRFTSPRRCALALVATEQAPPSVEIEVTASSARPGR
jgi:hypothetical protein